MIDPVRFEAFGNAWVATDARRFEVHGHGSDRIAVVSPVDPETGEALTEVRLGRCVRRSEYGVPVRFLAVRGHQGVQVLSNYTPGVCELPGRTHADLQEALAPRLAVFLAPLTREERFGLFLTDVARYAASELRRARSEVELHQYRALDLDDPLVRDRTAAEEAAVQAVWGAALDTERAEHAAVRVPTGGRP